MKRSVVNCFVHTLCLVLVFFVLETSGKECGDPNCESVIATGKAKIRFRGGGGQKVNLDQNENLEILAKNVGKNEDFLVRKASGVTGLAPKEFVREQTILIRTKDRIRFDDAVNTNTLDIKPTQPATNANGLKTTVVEGTVLTNDVLADSPSAKAAAIDAPSSVKSTPIMEVVPTTQMVENNQPNNADVSKNETVEETDDGSEELSEADDTEEYEEEEAEEEEEDEDEDVSEEVDDDIAETNDGAAKVEDTSADNTSGKATTAEVPKTQAATEKEVQNVANVDSKGAEADVPKAETTTEKVQSNVVNDDTESVETGGEATTADSPKAEATTEKVLPNVGNDDVQSTEAGGEFTTTAEGTTAEATTEKVLTKSAEVGGQDTTADASEEKATAGNVQQNVVNDDPKGADAGGKAATAYDAKAEATTKKELPTAGNTEFQHAKAAPEEKQTEPDHSSQTASESVPSTNETNTPPVKDNKDAEQQSGADEVDKNVREDSPSATGQTTDNDDKSIEAEKNFNDTSESDSEELEPESSTNTTTENPSASEPAPVTEAENNDTPSAVEFSKNSDSQPTHPNRILAGGLGNLLAHSHHHHHGHHHHHHAHDHHHHHHHHHPHDHEERASELKPVDKNVQTVGDTHLHFPAQVDMPQTTLPQDEDAGNVRQNAEPIENNHLHSTETVAPVQAMTGHGTEVSAENGYCDSTGIDCAPPAAPFVPPSIKHSNGGSDYIPMDQDVRTDEGETEQSQDKARDGLTEHLEGAFGSKIQQALAGDYIDVFVQEAMKLSDLILMLAITSFTLLVFSLGHYLINKNRREKPLIYKLNMVERDLMTSHKESALLKSELQETKHKLTSIENNSFGSNDMVIALKAELEAAEQAKLELQEQIAGLEKELENAAEAGLELNKMVAELLNQNGSDSIALSVEELQRQLNEQQQTILSMNASLAEKSRENSELQIAIASQTGKFSERLEELEMARTELTDRRKQLEEEVASLQSEQRTKVDSMRKETGAEINRLMKELRVAQSKADESRKALAAVEAKCEALEECLNEVKSDGGSAGKGMIDSIELKAQIALLTKEKATMLDKLQGETIARQLVEDHMKMVNEEISTIKREFGKAEKEKLEAETRLEVLSSYFKDKETHLQKELSVKEAMWMQQQGETTTTVEKIRHMQDEIQQLKSQNDKLRAEIEAQATAHKAQYTTLETRSHDAWLTARQAERRLEEARSESSALRRKLTALGDISASSDGMVNLPNASITQTDLGLTAPSPIRVESPNAPQLMGVLPPPPFLPPYMPGPPPPFMPPFMPPPHGPGEMRPPPLGRLMSPPPPNNRYSPNNIIDARDRYSPDRGRYSPDSRYDYSVMSTYETENDFSPPPSPPHHTRHSNYDRDRERERDRERDRDRDRGSDRERPHRDGRGSGSGGYSRGYTPTGMRTSPPIQDPRNKKYAGGFSSGSQDSLGTRKSSGKYRGTGKPVL